MPVSGGAGRRFRSTRAPVCKPTPVVRIELLRVLCLSMVGWPSLVLKDADGAICMAAQGVSRGDSTIIRRAAARSRTAVRMLSAGLSVASSYPARHSFTHGEPLVGLLAQERRNVGRIEAGGMTAR